LARLGASTRLEELKQEISAIEALLGGRSAGTAKSARKGSRKVGRRGWTAAQRKAAADRMKTYWAKWRAGKKK
jgi:hypothetical protein